MALLALVNLGGTAYGFYWYWPQLVETPWFYWPLVPDSPGSTGLFGLFLLALLAGRERPYLGALAMMANVKYGFWTPLIMAHFWISTGTATFESIHLSLSHLGMALQAVLFLPVYRPPLAAALLAFGLLLFNDYVDYAWGLHPFLPLAGQEGLAGAVAFLMTAVSLITYGALAWRKGAGRRKP